MSTNVNNNNNTTAIRGSGDPNYKSQRTQAELEEKARQRTNVRFQDEKGHQWNEIHTTIALKEHLHRDPQTKRLKAYSSRRSGQENKSYEIVGLSVAPPEKWRRDRK